MLTFVCYILFIPVFAVLYFMADTWGYKKSGRPAYWLLMSISLGITWPITNIFCLAELLFTKNNNYGRI